MRSPIILGRSAGACLLALALAACGNNNNNNAKNDAAVPMDAPAGGPDASCFDLSTIGSNATNDQIINACTNAEKVTITATLPLLGSNGQLPPLP
jgi:hypothetical protein